MPIYEYLCQDCENRFEIKATIKEREEGAIHLHNKEMRSYCKHF